MAAESKTIPGITPGTTTYDEMRAILEEVCSSYSEENIARERLLYELKYYSDRIIDDIETLYRALLTRINSDQPNQELYACIPNQYKIIFITLLKKYLPDHEITMEYKPDFGSNHGTYWVWFGLKITRIADLPAQPPNNKKRKVSPWVAP
jgi:hypothetical protein